MPLRTSWRDLGWWRWPLAALAVFALLLTMMLWPVRHSSDGKDDEGRRRVVSCKILRPEQDCKTSAQPGDGAIDDSNASATDLVVLLHAFNSSFSDLEPLCRVVNKEMPRADTLACDLPFQSRSMVPPEEVVADLVSKIDEAWEAKKKNEEEYDRVYLVGHSMGALFARKAYVVAAGENELAPFKPELKELLAGPQPPALLEARPWARAVERIVLMAGMNRGWSISHHMSLLRAVKMSVGVWVGEVRSLFYCRPPLIFSIRRGASFITQLRIQWLEMRRQVAEEKKTAGGATTVQLLGSIDDLVSPEDNVDLVSGCDFVYLDVKWSGHRNVIDMDLEAEKDSPPWERATQFIKAMRWTWTPEKLEKEHVLPADVALFPQCRPAAVESVAVEGSSEPEATDLTATDPVGDIDQPVTDVVFVIHGIRDEGYWTQKIARRVISKAREQGRRVVSETSAYGYFPMLPFLSSQKRREKVEWLMDRYTEARARYPDAKFHYVGHSNGTYLLAKALEEYRSCRFERAVFVGSVVRSKFDWLAAKRRNQVGEVLNFVATGDWIVGFFPNGLEMIGWQDLGGAGHDGFVKGAIEPKSEDGTQRMYVKGGHSAARGEAYWNTIAEFVLFDEVPRDFAREVTKRPGLEFEPQQAGWVRFPAMVAPLMWLVIFTIVGLGFYGLLKLPLGEWLRTVIILGYLALIWTILFRV